jgi:hypothetical protein
MACFWRGWQRSETIKKDAMSRDETNNPRASRKEAEPALLDQLCFSLSEDDFKRFTAMLDSPPKDNPKLRRLLETKAPWER